ncbi:hypothetical protein C9374_000901 [Naegleria lovaniensis]|uniref:Methylated-DNA--protein-cysteine methyltransferase n=1 Tax=Naegleria lovaniensis TaxID=51637 RepID=A0AA88GTE1_NAELO|nr:uncharacterized protein C9374_000901 [Naegleria lovaniensis]KAG2388051.1 hypothetical protein C9374_000901 [Naegleria lovaniensis]
MSPATSPTSFQQKVYAALMQIPKGKVTTYALLAQYIDCNSSQAIGQALKRNPYAPAVPCHRVIKSDYKVGGFMGETVGEEIERKLSLLKEEGVLFDSKHVLIDKSLIFDFSDCEQVEFSKPTGNIMMQLTKKIKKSSLYRKLVPKIPIREELRLSAWQKFIKYRRFPFKFCTHMLLLILVTTQLFLFAGNREDYLSNAGKIIANNFLPQGYLSLKDAKTGFNTFYFDDCEDIVNHIGWTVNQYYDLKERAPTYLEFAARDGSGSFVLGNSKSVASSNSKFNVEKLSTDNSKAKSNEETKRQLALQQLFESRNHAPTALMDTKLNYSSPIEMIITRYQNITYPIDDYVKRLNKDITSATFFLSKNDTYGPFKQYVQASERTAQKTAATDQVVIIDREGLQKYMFSFTEMTLKFTYKNIYTKGIFPELLIWDITLRYDFATGAGIVPVTLSYDVGLGAETTKDISVSVLSSPLTWISLLIIMLSLFSLFLIARAFYRSFKFIRKAMKKDRSIFQLVYQESNDNLDEPQSEPAVNESTPLVSINSTPPTKPVAVKSSLLKRYDNDIFNDSFTGSAVSGMTFTSQYYQQMLEQHKSELHELQEDDDKDVQDSLLKTANTRKAHSPGIPSRIVTGEIGNPSADQIAAASQKMGMNFKPDLKHKLKFFNPWHILGIISNVLCLVSSAMVFANVAYQYFSLDATNILLGLSSIFVWANIVQYLSHSPKFYVLIKALRKGLPNIGRFIIGAAPLLIGYALCGMVLFGSYTSNFQGFQNSIVTLFSAANGDSLIDVFSSLYGQNIVIAYFSRLYLITFVCLFTYSVINIFILIMEDAYFSVKENNMKKEAAEAAAKAIEEFKKSHTNHGDDNNEDNSTNMLGHHSDTMSKGKIAQQTDDVDDDMERLQQERFKIDELINLLSELRSGQLLGDPDDQDPQTIIQQKRLSEKLTRLLVNRNLKKIRRKKSTGEEPYKTILSSSFRKEPTGGDEPRKKKETKFNLDLNESIDDVSIIEGDDDDDLGSPPTPRN